MAEVPLLFWGRDCNSGKQPTPNVPSALYASMGWHTGWAWGHDCNQRPPGTAPQPVLAAAVTPRMLKAKVQGLEFNPGGGEDPEQGVQCAHPRSSPSPPGAVGLGLGLVGAGHPPRGSPGASGAGAGGSAHQCPQPRSLLSRPFLSPSPQRGLPPCRGRLELAPVHPLKPVWAGIIWERF